MNEQITKQEVEEIIHMMCCCKDGKKFEFCEPKIGDVLEKWFKKRAMNDIELCEFIDAWHNCGVSKSLQQIAESGWENRINEETLKREDNVLNPQANALFLFLKQYLL